MYIKRNIKKRTTGQSANTTQHQSLRSTGQSKYKLPIYSDVPPGNYFSEIVYAGFTTTSKGKPAIEVHYKMISSAAAYKKANGIPLDEKDSKVYHVKQIYPEGTEFYHSFIDSMDEALAREGEEFTLDEVVGVTEYVSIGYDEGCDIGGIKRRHPCDFEDFIKEEEPDEESEDEYEDEYYVEPGYELDF